MPVAEVDVHIELVRGLLREQHPDLADLGLTELASGWDNVLLRLGEELIVRMPRRAMAAELVEHELRWLPELAPRLPLAVPVPVRAGRPGLGYPWSWSVVRWLPGEMAAVTPPRDPAAAAASLGGFLDALHQPAPRDAPANPFRGGPLADRDEPVRTRADQLHDLIDAPRVLACWRELVDTPVWARDAVWLHGDLHPANVLVHGGEVSAVVDFGDITAGDPATDLAIGWSMFDEPARTELRDAAGDVDDDTWVRARGWAVHLSLAYLSSSADNPLLARIGQRMLAAAITTP
jgi:aminoglycoside phosphotransferase (APT) family kinase protein